VALTVAFLGGLLVLKPRFDLTILPALAALASAFFAGAAYTVVRHLRTLEPPEVIILWFSALTTLSLLPVAPGLARLSPWEAAAMVGVGVGAAGGQFGLTVAFRHAPAGEVSVYSYTIIVFSAVLGLLLFAEVPDATSLIGGALILGGALAATTGARRV
jgi:drug/metabolite transporter (DMT)-like permease